MITVKVTNKGAARTYHPDDVKVCFNGVELVPYKYTYVSLHPADPADIHSVQITGKVTV